jgi:hypothetical protein
VRLETNARWARRWFRGKLSPVVVGGHRRGGRIHGSPGGGPQGAAERGGPAAVGTSAGRLGAAAWDWERRASSCDLGAAGGRPAAGHGLTDRVGGVGLA